MKKISYLTLIAALVIFLAACGGSDKKGNAALEAKKTELDALKKEQADISKKIVDLEKEIEKLDPDAVTAKPKLVAVATIGNDTFSHYIDLQGKIDANNVAYVSPRGQGGTVKAVLVKQGQTVRKGQLILRLDDVLAQQQVSQAQQQIAGIESQLKLAQSIYERQQNLWKQNIGTEVQVLQAKTNADALASQLNSAKAGVRLAQEQAGLSNVYAEISGVVDQVNVKVGEFFSPQSAAMPQSGIRIVNTSELKVLVQVPENYLGKVKEGSVLEVSLPEGNKKFTSKVSVAGQFIDPNTRSFYIEGKVPASKEYSPNQIAMVRIMDYSSDAAITIPINILQNDEKGKYVMVAVKEKDGKLYARKKPLTIGELYSDKLEVKDGLKQGDVIIVEGYQNLYDGQLLTTEVI